MGSTGFPLAVVGIGAVLVTEKVTIDRAWGARDYASDVVEFSKAEFLNETGAGNGGRESVTLRN